MKNIFKHLMENNEYKKFGFKLKELKAIGNQGLFVFQSENFNGYGVTFGCILEVKSGTYKIRFKASICSNEDAFDSDTGINIVIGRLLKDNKFNTTFTVDSRDSVAEYSLSFITSKIDELEEYIDFKESARKHLAQTKQEVNLSLKEQFSKFK